MILSGLSQNLSRVEPNLAFYGGTQKTLSTFKSTTLQYDRAYVERKGNTRDGSSDYKVNFKNSTLIVNPFEL